MWILKLFIFLKELFSAVLIHDAKWLYAKGSGAFKEWDLGRHAVVASVSSRPSCKLTWRAARVVLSPGATRCMRSPPGVHLPLDFLSLQLDCQCGSVPWDDRSLVIGFCFLRGNSEVVCLSSSLTDTTTFIWVPGSREREEEPLQPLGKTGKAKGVYVTKSIAWQNQDFSLPISPSYLTESAAS